LLMVPTWGVTAHVMAVFEFPLTLPVKVALWPPWSETVLGDKLRLTVAGAAVAVRVTMALAILVGSATLEAVMVTVCWLEMLPGAV
jgi:hypothetical protein